MPILCKEPGRFPDNVLDQSFHEEAKSKGQSWWAIWTKPRQEKSLMRELRSWQVPCYLPLVEKRNLIRGKKVRSYLPLFPGYLFSLTDDDGRVQAMKTNRICTVLPVPDPDQLRSDLAQLDALIEAGVPLTIEERLAPGRRVAIRRGALAGIEGVVVERRGRSRLLVAVHFLQSGVSLEIEDFLLEPR